MQVNVYEEDCRGHTVDSSEARIGEERVRVERRMGIKARAPTRIDGHMMALFGFFVDSGKCFGSPSGAR